MAAPAEFAQSEPTPTESFVTNLTPCGGVRKMLMRAAPADAPARPSWGAVVDVRFTGLFVNGSSFYDAHAQEPFSFQLNTGTVVDGMDRGVRTMRPGERALLRVESRWAYGGGGVGHRIPPNATLVYDVELVGWRDGPPFENQDFDMDTYRSSLEGKDVSGGQNELYTWSESGEEVTMWLPLRDGERASDMSCDFSIHHVSVAIGSDSDGNTPRRVAGQLKGRAVPDESYWFIEDEHPEYGRALQVVFAKAGLFTRWDGVLTDEPDESGDGERPLGVFQPDDGKDLSEAERLLEALEALDAAERREEP